MAFIKFLSFILNPFYQLAPVIGFTKFDDEGYPIEDAFLDEEDEDEEYFEDEDFEEEDENEWE